MEYKKKWVKSYRVDIVHENNVVAICFRGGGYKWYAVEILTKKPITSELGTLKDAIDAVINHFEGAERTFKGKGESVGEE